MEYWMIGAIAIAVIYIIYRYLSRGLDHFQKLGIPCLEPVPFFGNFAGPMLGTEAMPFAIQRAYNVSSEAKYVGFYDFTTPVVLIRDPELVKSVAVKNFEHFVDHRSFSDDSDYLFSKNLFSLRGDKWKDIRNLLTPAFTSSKMKSMFDLMSKVGADFATFITDLPEKDVEVKDLFSRYTNDVIASCAFGLTVDSLRNPENEFFLNGKRATNFQSKIQAMKFFVARNFPTACKVLGVKLIPREVTKYFEDVIKTAIKTRDEKGIRRPDMIQLMMDTRGKREADKELTIEDMTSQAFIFFFGGFDTSSTAMLFTSYLLAINPETQDILQNEIDKVLEENNGEFTYESVNQMEYLDAVVNESLRLYPIGSFLDRVTVKEFEFPPALPGCKPLTVKPGDAVWIPVFPYNHDPQYYEEPEKFKPQRFIEDGKKIFSSGVYISFGLGPRMCIANRFALLEVKIVLCQLLARCNLKPCAKTQIPLKLSTASIDMATENGCWLRIEPRNDGYLFSNNL